MRAASHLSIHLSIHPFVNPIIHPFINSTICATLNPCISIRACQMQTASTQSCHKCLLKRVRSRRVTHNLRRLQLNGVTLQTSLPRKCIKFHIKRAMVRSSTLQSVTQASKLREAYHVHPKCIITPSASARGAKLLRRILNHQKRLHCYHCLPHHKLLSSGTSQLQQSNATEEDKQINPSTPTTHGHPTHQKLAYAAIAAIWRG